MPTLPSEQELRSMNYRDLQRVCKGWGVRANLKSDEMIDLLLQAQSQTPPVPLPPAPQSPARPRSVSTRRTSSRTGQTRLSSIIIHDVPEEEISQQTVSALIETRTIPDLPAPLPDIPTRTKKAKELQRRLGVGRPVAVGGSGPRVVTRSATVSRNKSSRISRNTQSSEAVIQEEPETSLSPQTHQTDLPSPPRAQPPTAGAEELSDPLTFRRKEQHVRTPGLRPDLEALISHFVKPLQSQIDTLWAEVKRLQSLEAQLKSFSSLVQQRRETETSRDEELYNQKRPLYTVEPTTPPSAPNLELPPEPQPLMPSPRIMAETGVAPALLGKRFRVSSSTGQSSDVQNEGQPGSPQGTSQPVKKRPKLSEKALSNKGKEVAQAEPPSRARDGASFIPPRVPSIVVYNDPDDAESPPPDNLLPDYYKSQSEDLLGSPKYDRSVTPSSPRDDLNPFNFSLLPEPSTPGPTLFLPAFPYPEPPQSPTPAGASVGSSLPRNPDRSDIFKTFGLPPPERTRRLPSSSANNMNNPPMPSQSSHLRRSSGDDARPGFGLNSVPSSDPAVSPERDLKRTMYGTELDGDTRFGDFGVEGVATGFWTTSRF